MELILVLAFAWAGVRAIGETIANTVAAVRGAALPYPPAGSRRVQTRTAGGSTVSYAAGRGGGALAGLAWESGKAGWAKGWSWGTTRVQEARIRRGAGRTRLAAAEARRTVDALDSAEVTTAVEPADVAGPAPELETRPADQRPEPDAGDGDDLDELGSRRQVVHDEPTYLMGAELEAWRQRHPDDPRAVAPDQHGGAWLDPDGRVSPPPERFVGSPAEQRLQELRAAGYEGPVDADGHVKEPAQLSPAQQNLLRRQGYQHSPPAPGQLASPTETGAQPARHLSVVPVPAAPGDSRPHPTNGDPGPGAATTTEGITMTTTTGETTNIEATRTYLSELAAHVQSDILSQLELATSTLLANNVDQATLGDLATIREQFDQAVSALGDLAGAITDRHGAVEEAINSADEVAETDWYRHQ